MQYRTINANEDKLSILGYGCMRFPTKMGSIDEEVSSKLLMRAIDEGVNYFDTAYPYHMGQSESFLGTFFKEHNLRQKVYIATKLPTWIVNSRKDMESFFKIQCDRLQTDYIDYYLLHSMTGSTWDKLEALGIVDFMNELKASGKIKNMGFSFHDQYDSFTKIVDAYDWDFCQIQYNILDEHYQAGKEGLEYAASKGLGVIVMEPLRGGNLAGKVPEPVRKVLHEAETKRNSVEWALKWIWNHPEVTLLLSGMSEMAHVEDNCRYAGEAQAGSFTQTDLAVIDRVKKEFKKIMPVGCTGCRYCLPCPAGVRIPSIFTMYNNLFMFPKDLSPKVFYLSQLTNFEGGKHGYASLCIECGKCEKHCPQNIEIRKLLKGDVVKRFEGLLFKIARGLIGLFMKIIKRRSKRALEKNNQSKSK